MVKKDVFMDALLQKPYSRRVLIMGGLLGLGAVTGCAPLVVGGVATGLFVAIDRRTSGTQLEDEAIEVKSASRLREELNDRGHINVTSFNRQVLLTGEVPSEQDRQRAQAAVAGVENVRSIVNELAVMGSSSLSQRSNDTVVTGRVKAAMVDARDLQSRAFKVVTERNIVYLMGLVTQREADRATQVARNTQGVARVVRVLEIISEAELQRLQPPPANNNRSSSPSDSSGG
jgi:osmotically-inducible protein OsmY